MKDMFIQTVMMFSQTVQINPEYYKLFRELEEVIKGICRKKINSSKIP